MKALEFLEKMTEFTHGEMDGDQLVKFAQMMLEINRDKEFWLNILMIINEAKKQQKKAKLAKLGERNNAITDQVLTDS